MFKTTVIASIFALTAVSSFADTAEKPVEVPATAPVKFVITAEQSVAINASLQKRTYEQANEHLAKIVADNKKK